jgi:hypothetical protein
LQLEPGPTEAVIQSTQDRRGHGPGQGKTDACPWAAMAILEPNRRRPAQPTKPAERPADDVPHDPTKGLPTYDLGTPRDRFLDEDEIRLFWPAMRDAKIPIRDIDKKVKEKRDGDKPPPFDPSIIDDANSYGSFTMTKDGLFKALKKDLVHVCVPFEVLGITRRALDPGEPKSGSTSWGLDSGAKRNALKRSGFEHPFQARQVRLGMAS